MEYNVSLNELTIEEIELIKELFETHRFKYKKFQNVCDDIHQHLQPDSFYIIKRHLKYFYENIDPDCKTLYKKFKLGPFLKYPEEHILVLKDFAKIREYSCEEFIEKLNERLMEIQSEVFPDVVLKPEDNSAYQAKKKTTQEQRKSFYDEVYKDYNSNTKKEKKTKNKKNFAENEQ